jgi:hypothetical protein
MVSEDEDVEVDFFKAAHLATERGSTPTLNEFNESEHDGEWLQIGRFLKTMTPVTEWTREEACRIRKKAYRFFLRDGRIWKHPKRRNGVPLRVVTKEEEQEELLTAFHESPWAGHRGTYWATFEKLKGRYWWPGLYRDVHRFVTTCERCEDRVGSWPRLLPYALWADRTTHSSVTGFMPVELMYGQKPIMPTEQAISTWVTVDWKDEMSREELLVARIRQLQRRLEDVEQAAENLRAARVKNKERFDRTHRLRPKKIEEGDWVLVYDSSLDHQYKSTWKFAR